MKKMLFSAIALVAFTATTMAGEIEETKTSKKTEKTEILEQNELIILKARDCQAERQIAYLAALGDGFNASDASGMSYHIYFWCMSSQF